MRIGWQIDQLDNLLTAPNHSSPVERMSWISVGDSTTNPERSVVLSWPFFYHFSCNPAYSLGFLRVVSDFTHPGICLILALFFSLLAFILSGAYLCTEVKVRKQVNFITYKSASYARAIQAVDCQHW